MFDLNFTYATGVNALDIQQGEFLITDPSAEQTGTVESLFTSSNPNVSFEEGDSQTLFSTSNGTFTFSTVATFNGFRDSAWGWVSHDPEGENFGDFVFLVEEGYLLPDEPEPEPDPIPEPSTFALLLVAGIGGMMKRKKA